MGHRARDPFGRAISRTEQVEIASLNVGYEPQNKSDIFGYYFSCAWVFRSASWLLYEETGGSASANTRSDGSVTSFLASKPRAFPSRNGGLFPGASLRSDPCNLEELGIGPDSASGEYPRAPDPVHGTTS